MNQEQWGLSPNYSQKIKMMMMLIKIRLLLFYENLEKWPFGGVP